MQTLSDLHPASVGSGTPSSVSAAEQRMLAVVASHETVSSRTSCEAVTAALYHLSTGGQRVRAKLALHAGMALGLTPKDSEALAVACELLHNASLVHDDLHDRDTLRRGQSSVWHRFGDAVAICTGDLMLSAAYLVLSQFSLLARLPSLFALMHRRVSSAVQGQCEEINPGTIDGPGIDHFKKIARIKSGALLSLPTELALLAAGQDLNLAQARQAAESFAIGYQIFDDLSDVDHDFARNAVKYPHQHQGRVDRSSVCNIVLILRADPACSNARDAAVEIGLQHLLLAASSAAGLPLNSGGALCNMTMQLHEKLRSLA